MALMGAAAGANNFCSHHAVAGVTAFSQMLLGKRRGETWPAGATLELRGGFKQGQPAETARVDSLPLLGEEHTTEWRLRAVFEQYLPLLVGQIVDQLPELLASRRSKVEPHRWDPFGRTMELSAQQHSCIGLKLPPAAV